MKFYSQENEVVTITSDLEEAERCHYLSMKSDQNVEKDKPRQHDHALADLTLEKLLKILDFL